MPKLRDARYCNLKLFLIYLVIYGHLIESQITSSQMLMSQYRWIYLFHMPLFSFLSGLFLTGRQACEHQIKKLFPLYIFLQFAAVVLGRGSVSLLTPYWHLWYLLSCSTWTGAAWLWFRLCRGRGKILILVCAVLIGCAAGLVPSIGRTYSLSRTLVFFPYFWIGILCDSKIPWEKFRPLALLALVVVLIVMVNGGNEMPVTFLYQATPYSNLKIGCILRLLCYLLGTLLCMFMISFTPTRRFHFTKVGADTMPAYLIHAPVVLWLRELRVPVSFYPLIAAFLIYLSNKITQWHEMYGIVPPERRGRQWQLFKKSMRSTPTRSIDSCCH